MKTKTCTRCKTEYPATTGFFRTAKEGKYGLRGECKKCSVICGTVYRNNHKKEINTRRRETAYPEKTRIRNLKSHYGLTPVDYNRMFVQQSGRCAICGIPQFELKYRLHVDHDHDTKRIRGLLCGNCNVGMGHFRHDINLLLKAGIYLEQSK